MVDRVKSTFFASIAPAGVVVIVMHTSTVESFSATIAMIGIEKDAAAQGFKSWTRKKISVVHTIAILDCYEG